MTPPVMELVRSLEQDDIRLEVVDGRLRVDAPKGRLTPALRELLQEKKTDLVAALTSDWAGDAKRVIAELPDESVRSVLVDFFEETAAFIEFEQNRPRQEAEQHAFGLLLFQILKRGIDVKVPA
jgi:hypothetical protein